MDISFIIPSLEHGNFIKRTLDSIFEQCMDGLEYEVIVIDGGSTDSTLDILASHPIKPVWTSEVDQGQAHAINKGLESSSGDIIAWINSDDYYLENAIAKVIACFKENKNARILYGKAYHVGEGDEILEQYPTEEWNYDRLKETCFICQPAVFFKRSIIEEFGYLDESLDLALDYDYWMRIGQSEPFHYLREDIAASRTYEQNKTQRFLIEGRKEAFNVVVRYTNRFPRGWASKWAYFKANEIPYISASKTLQYGAKSIIIAFLRLKFSLGFKTIR